MLGAKYNPERRKTFRPDHWSSVTGCVAAFALRHQIIGLSAWAQSHGAIAAPRKSDQDLLDAVLCAMVGYLWLYGDRSELLVIGDLQSGYMVTPAVGEARARLIAAARTRAVLAR